MISKVSFNPNHSMMLYAEISYASGDQMVGSSSVV